MLQECFTKGIINARILTNESTSANKGMRMLSKLAIMGNFNRI